MDVTFATTLDGVDWEEMAQVFECAPLGKREPDKLRRAFAASDAVCCAYHETRLIGAARALCDGEYYAAVYDVVVLPEYQSQGVGSRIMTALLANLPVNSIILVSVAGKEPFYQKLGFASLKMAMGRFANPDRMRQMGTIE